MVDGKVKRKIIVNDPIHEVMDFGSDEDFRIALKGIIDSASFQRLRRISQLGLASFVFPGATHSRFSHSLGAAYLAYEVTGHLLEQEETQIAKVVKKNRLPIVMSALLHDVGHGPFSHSFEHVLKDLVKETKSKFEVPMHEDWTAEIIKNKKSEIGKMISKSGIDPELVASPFQKGARKKYPPFLKQIVSSQIDVDRMDYLLRDSHFAGVSMGTLDLYYLINCLHVIKHGERRPFTLGITSKGVKPYEAYVIARQLMNRSVYYHKKVKVIEHMVESVFRLLLTDLKKLRKRRKIAPLIPDYFTVLDGALNSSKKTQKADFLNEGLRPYIQLTEDNFWVLAKALAEEDLGEISELSKKILSRTVLDSEMIKTGKEKIAEEILEAAKIKKGTDFVIVELKTTMYKDLSEDDQVFVLGNEGEIDDIASRSHTISLFKDKPEVEKLLIIKNPLRTNKIVALLRKADARVS